MKIKIMITALVLAAIPFASSFGAEEAATSQTADAAPAFTMERAYFGSQLEPAGSSLAGLVRSLDRARENGMTRKDTTQTVAYADFRRYFHGNSMQKLVNQQDWRVRVSRELKALLD